MSIDEVIEKKTTTLLDTSNLDQLKEDCIKLSEGNPLFAEVLYSLNQNGLKTYTSCIGHTEEEYGWIGIQITNACESKFLTLLQTLEQLYAPFLLELGEHPYGRVCIIRYPVPKRDLCYQTILHIDWKKETQPSINQKEYNLQKKFSKEIPFFSLEITKELSSFDHEYEILERENSCTKKASYEKTFSFVQTLVESYLKGDNMDDVLEKWMDAFLEDKLEIPSFEAFDLLEEMRKIETKLYCILNTYAGTSRPLEMDLSKEELEEIQNLPYQKEHNAFLAVMTNGMQILTSHYVEAMLQNTLEEEDAFQK